MTRKTVIVCSILLAISLGFTIFAKGRIDLTDDKRYSLHPATLSLLEQLDQPITATLYLDGNMNAGFVRLQRATIDLMKECRTHYSSWKIEVRTPDETEQKQLVKAGYIPIVIHERERDGKTTQTPCFPYLKLQYGNKQCCVRLLQNVRGREQNLNQSIENLEYALAENLHQLRQNAIQKIAFLEGHGELPEANVYDLSVELSKYFQIDRGVLGTSADELNDYQAVIVADPQQAFSEKDKYILDQYLMQGGHILWLVNGVKFSQTSLSNQGFTPVMGLDLNLEDLFFKYGFKVRPILVQDLQCLQVPVNISPSREQPNYQPVPWFYAPLLLTSERSAITRNLGQVSSIFASPIEVLPVDSLGYEVLLATSSDTRLIGTPAKVDLADFNPNPNEFTYRHAPVAVALEGRFSSLYAHRQAPREITHAGQASLFSQPTKQVVVGCGNIIRNEWAEGQPLPLGLDRYSQMVFANKDFLTNAILWLTDAQGLIELRQKQVALRLLNTQQVLIHRTTIQCISTLVPVGILIILGIVIIFVRKYKYSKL